MTTFNHAYSINFSLSSKARDGSDVTPTMLRSALLRRIAELDEEQAHSDRNFPKAGHNHWDEACGMPSDTYEEA